MPLISHETRHSHHEIKKIISFITFIRQVQMD